MQNRKVREWCVAILKIRVYDIHVTSLPYVDYGHSIATLVVVSRRSLGGI